MGKLNTATISWLILGMGTGLSAGIDWPGWRGPDRNGISPETGWSWNWGTNGPTVLWRQEVGKGFSSFAVAGNRVYTMGNSNNVDTVFCFTAATGEVVWKHSYPCELQPLSYEGGPGSTPLVNDGRVYTFSKGGDLFCLDADTGSVVWSNKFELWQVQKGDWANTWRYAGSPLVVGDRLFMSVGRAGAAFDKKNGAPIWKSALNHPGYSSPVPYQVGTTQSLALFSGREIIGVMQADGHELWSIPWRTLWDLNAADPIVHDGRMFVSSGNGVGCALFDIRTNPPAQLWRNKNLMTTMNAAVLWEGHLYGFNDSRLACLSWDTGEELWTNLDLRKGSLIVADGKLVLLSESGRLVIARPNPKRFESLAEAVILEGRCWTTPVLSHGGLYARNAAGQMVCLDLESRSGN